MGTIYKKVMGFIILCSSLITVNSHAVTQVCDGKLARIQADKNHDGLSFFEELGRSGTAWCNYSDDGILDKPIIIAEGFDFSETVSQNEDDNTDGAEIWTMLNVWGDAEKLRAKGYDFIIIDYDDPLAPIQSNALLFSKLIEIVNQEKKGIFKNIVAGFSMGGLVAKTALSFMEYDEVDHQTSLYVSLDSPHGCAQINTDLQMLVQYGAAQNDDAEIKRLWEEVLRSDAALQIMCNTAHDYDDGIGVDFSGRGRVRKLRGAFGFNRLRYSRTGNGFPLLTRNISFTNGGGQTHLADPGELLVDLNQKRDNLNIFAKGGAVPNDTMPGSTAPWFDMLGGMLPDRPTIFYSRTTYISTLSAIGLGPVQVVTFGPEGRSEEYWSTYEKALHAQRQDQEVTDAAIKDMSDLEIINYFRGRSLMLFYMLDAERPIPYLTSAVDLGLFPKKQECNILIKDGVEEEHCRTLANYNTDLTTVDNLASLTPFDAVYINTDNDAHNSFPSVHSINLVDEIISNTVVRYEIILPAINMILL